MIIFELGKRNLLYISILFTLIVFHSERLYNLGLYTYPKTNELWIVKLVLTFLLGSLFISIFYRRRGVLLLANLCAFYLFGVFDPVNYGADTFAGMLLFIHFFVVNCKDDFLGLIGFGILVFMLVVIYTYSGFSKMLDPSWRNGEVVLSLLNSVSGGAIYKIRGMGAACQVVSWFVILLQVLSPLIFVKRLRVTLSSFLIAKHVLIGIFLLPYFGILCVLIHLIVIYYTNNVLDHKPYFDKIKRYL